MEREVQTRRVCLYVHRSTGVPEDQKKFSHPLRTGVISCLRWPDMTVGHSGPWKEQNLLSTTEISL